MQRRTLLQTSAALALSTSLPAFSATAGGPLDRAIRTFADKTPFDLHAFTAEVAELVSIDSKTGHEEGNTRIVEIFAECFRSIGWAVETPYCEGRGKALLATNRPDAKRYDVVLCAHTDTVQPVGNAAKHPFRLVDGIAYGAGVADDKSSLNAVWWIAKDLPVSVTDRLAIAVVLNPGEESGSKATSAFLRGVAKKSDRVMVFEPGRGEVPGGGFVKVRKGAIFLKVRFHGKAAHAGNNPQDGRNAITAMALAIPEIQSIASKYPGVTINGDLVSGGTAVNTIAAEAEVTFDLRFADNASRDKVLADIKALCERGFLEGVRTEMVPPGRSGAMAETEASRALMALVDGAAADLGQPAPKWLTVGGASDGNLFAEYGAGVVCAMGVVGGRLHDPEKEWSDLRTARERIRLAQATLMRMAAALRN